jgi:hypothetical protein
VKGLVCSFLESHKFLKKSKPSLICRGINPAADKGKRELVTLEFF